MDILHSHSVDGFCIVSSDSDYTGLAKRIREEGLFVMGIGRKITPIAFVNSCEVFTFTENLIIEYDFGWPLRIIGLNWDSPDTETPLDKYKVYRKKEGGGFNYQGSSNITRYVDTIFEFRIKKYTYYVTAVYMDGTESGRSNEAKTTR